MSKGFDGFDLVSEPTVCQNATSIPTSSTTWCQDVALVVAPGVEVTLLCSNVERLGRSFGAIIVEDDSRDSQLVPARSPLKSDQNYYYHAVL